MAAAKEKRYRIDGQAAPGSDYVCSKCCAAGLRLWRQSGGMMLLSDVTLLCATCATEDQTKQIAAYAAFHGDNDTTIGDLVPARPTPEGDTFWGQTSGDVEWWYLLPQYADRDAEVAVLQRERNHFWRQCHMFLCSACATGEHEHRAEDAFPKYNDHAAEMAMLPRERDYFMTLYYRMLKEKYA